MDRLTAAAVLVETVTRGSISAAAAQLGMSRAMATRYIAMMEEWAGARLLHRTTRRLSLTPAGEEVLPTCKQMLALAGDVSAGQQADEAPRGVLRVTASSIFAQYCLADVLAAFLRLHPAVTLDLQIVDRTTNLAEDGIDLAIRVTREADPGVIARKLGDVHSVICASPAYLAARGTPVQAQDLAAHNCLSYAYHGSKLWRFSAQGEEIAVPISGNFSTNEAAVVVRAALNGTGIALLPWFAAAPAIADGALVPLLPGLRAESLGVYAVYLSRRRMPGALRALLDFLSDNMQALRMEGAPAPNPGAMR